MNQREPLLKEGGSFCVHVDNYYVILTTVLSHYKELPMNIHVRMCECGRISIRGNKQDEWRTLTTGETTIEEVGHNYGVFSLEMIECFDCVNKRLAESAGVCTAQAMQSQF